MYIEPAEIKYRITIPLFLLFLRFSTLFYAFLRDGMIKMIDMFDIVLKMGAVIKAVFPVS